jgi:hypothetical protein
MHIRLVSIKIGINIQRPTPRPHSGPDPLADTMGTGLHGAGLDGAGSIRQVVRGNVSGASCAANIVQVGKIFGVA